MNSNNSQQYEELYNHFFHIAEMIRGTVSIDTGSMLPILQVIVLKRFLDDYSVHGSKDYSQYWLTLRNLSAHNRLPQMMSELNRIYDEISDQNPLFRDVCFESYENRNIAETLPVIVLYLHNVDFSEFKKKDIGKAFNDFITKMFGGKYLGESVSSNFIRKLITSVIEIKPGDKIYDPAVGIGGFFVEASNYCTEEGIVSFEGQEKNFETYSICRLNLYMNGIDYRGIHCSDSLLHPINVPARFDRVVSDFPFNMKINKEEFNQILETDCFNRFDKELSSNSRGDYLFIQHIISSLDQKGKGAFLVPEGVLFRLGKEKLLRKEIVDSDVIHSLVFLPSGVLSNSMIPVVIMVIDKNKPLKLKRSIFMIDLTDEIKFERSSIVNSERVISKVCSVIENLQEITDYSKVVDIDRIADNDYNLLMHSYSDFEDELNTLLNEDSGIICKLSDVCDVISGRGSKIDNEKNGVNVIRTSDLEKEILDVELLQINKKTIRTNKHLFAKDALLISAIQGSLKPTILRTENFPEGVIIGNHIYAVVPKEGKVDLLYLYYQFYEAIVIKQIEARYQGAAMKRILKKDLLKLKIPLPSFEDQKKLIHEKREKLREIEYLRYQANVKKLDIIDEIREENVDLMRVLTHNVLPKISIFKEDFQSLKDFFTRRSLNSELVNKNGIFDEQGGGDDDLDELFLKNISAQTVDEIVLKIEKNIERISNVITKTRDISKIRLEHLTLEKVNIYNFLNTIVENKKLEAAGTYNISLIGNKNEYIFLNKVLFEEVIENLIRNAIQHAFTSDEKNKIKLKIDVDLESRKIIIIVSNNGTPFKILPADYKTPYKKHRTSSGDGLGGWFINTVIEAHEGSVIVETEEIGCRIRLEFPMIEGDQYE